MLGQAQGVAGEERERSGWDREEGCIGERDWILRTLWGHGLTCAGRALRTVGGRGVEMLERGEILVLRRAALKWGSW